MRKKPVSQSTISMAGRGFQLQDNNNSTNENSNASNRFFVKKSVTKYMEKSMEVTGKEEEINKLQNNYFSLEGRFKFNNELLLKMEEENQNEKRNYKESIRLFKDFFYQLLMIGKDCRQNSFILD